MSKEILFRTADGLTCIEKANYEVGPRIKRVVKKRMTASFVYEGSGSDLDRYEGVSAREYEYRGRVGELYVYEEVVTK